MMSPPQFPARSPIRPRLTRRCGEGQHFIRGILTSELNPGINNAVTETYTAFEGLRRLASGPLTEIAPRIKRAEARAAEPISIFSDATGRAIDLDLHLRDRASQRAAEGVPPAVPELRHHEGPGLRCRARLRAAAEGRRVRRQKRDRLALSKTIERPRRKQFPPA